MNNVLTVEEKAKNAIKWIEALEKGDFKQTHGLLNRGAKYCCGGVACVVTDTVFSSASAWSSEAMKKVGFSNKGGSLVKSYNTSRHTCCSLMSLNDTARLTFPDIAEVLKSDSFINFEPKVAEKLTEHYKS